MRPEEENQINIKNFDQLDTMAQIMAKAAMNKNINISILELDLNRTPARSKFWLQFTINKQIFSYAKGALFEYNDKKWFGVGRKLNHEATKLISDKYLIKCYLKERGFSVPKGEMLERQHITDFLSVYNKYNLPLCVKPNKGSEGKRVYPSIRNMGYYLYAIKSVSEKYPEVLIEESVTGKHFRFFYVYPKIVAIKCGKPMQVIGDGKSSIATLLDNKNRERESRKLLTHPIFSIDIDTLTYLNSLNLSLTDIPIKGEVITLRGLSNFTAGADTILYSNSQLHPSYLDTVISACQSIPGLRFTGVDLIIKDVNKPAQLGNHWFLELNASPAITGFYHPWKGATVDVADYILEMLKQHYPFI